jgi:hypothetical protein
MAYRKTFIQVKFRIREGVLRGIERDAKRHDRSVNDEIGRCLEDSRRVGKERQKMAKEREQMAREREVMARDRERMFEVLQGLVTAMMDDLRPHHDRKATQGALDTMAEDVERYLQNTPEMKDLFSTTGGNS